MLHERPSKDGKSVTVPGEQMAPVNPVPTHEEGLRIPRRLTQEGIHPYEEIEWELRDAVISNEKGEIAFEQRNVEVPKDWSQLATNVVAQKYFRGQLGSPERESSVKQLIDRVVKTAVSWGGEGGYFATDQDLDAFEAELTYLLAHQMVSFNSPVWFNCGIEEHPQVSDCFIKEAPFGRGKVINGLTMKAQDFMSKPAAMLQCEPIIVCGRDNRRCDSRKDSVCRGRRAMVSMNKRTPHMLQMD